MIAKSQLRKQIAAIRKSLSEETVSLNSRHIVERILKLEPFQKAETIALYMAFGGEVELSPLFSICWELYKRTCIPVFNEQTKIYEMAEITAETKFKTGNYDIKEPENAHRIPMNAIDLMLVPGVAFSTDGKRIGRGGGYYDRLLKGYQGTAVGVAFDEQIVAEIPCEAHDLPVDYIVTPSKIFIARNER